MAEPLIHGNLYVTISESDLTYNPGLFRKILHDIADQGANGLYVTIYLEKVPVGQTRIIKAERRSPRWDESFHIYCAHQAGNVVFSVIHARPIVETVVGSAYVPVNDLLGGQEFEQWLELVNKKRKPIVGGAKIRVKLRYFDVSHDQNWARGIRSPDFPGVPNTFFSQRKGCKVTLYQDAHVLDDFAPKILLAGGEVYQPHRCWEDIFDAINNAQHLIYITGWSVYTEITLIRDSKRPKPGGDETLGELLKKKASNGVTVLMLVWDDMTSDRRLKCDGLLATHDEETLRYFYGSKVKCVLCPRNRDNGQSFGQSLKNIMFTHHQKTVVVDSPLPGDGSQKWRIVSFVGGIDLCDGRYDTQFHPLFGTLDSVHHADFHQPNFTGGAIDKGGPREPWHDIHCKLEGSVAWDVLDNFQERWKKQSHEYFLLPLKKYSETIPRPPVTGENDPDEETWNVQVFRSIDGGSAFGFPETPEDAARSGLVRGQGTIIDRSIQDAYINAIRRAKDFIYIENQYFLGSSYGWKPDGIKVEDIGALRLIPKELSLKIVTKIEAGEQFRVYIVVPMWPEGLPNSFTVQEILDWQMRTMEMMYKDIAQALRAKQMYDADPKEYLTFFCLGNREIKKSGEYIPQEHPEEDYDYKRAQENRRFMIYVHSKMMIVDDEYIIIGSANVNQRSMDGARDSEIAMGAYQPYRLAVNQPARGQIHGFRMSLWYEHTGLLDELFRQPESLECIREVNKIAERYWDLYSSESLERDLPGHLLMYPVGVTNAGEVTELPGTEFFPDTKARVLGTKSGYLPPILTTWSGSTPIAVWSFVTHTIFRAVVGICTKIQSRL